MKVDVTTIFFNSVIPEATATAPWCVSIGQGKEKKINASIDGLQDILDGLIYKAVREQEFVDLSAGSKNNEYLLLSKFDKVFVNGSQINNLQMVVALVREHTKSHEGRLRISLPPYAKFDDGEIEFSNEQSYQAISEFLGCGNIYDGGCWFVDDISVHDQDELHFSCVVVNQNERMSYKTSQLRSAEWQGLVPEEHNYMRIPCIPQSNDTLQLIYYGAPGTGKSFTIDKATNENNSVRTTFHPDSDYASFVGAYKPTMAPMPVHAFVGTTVHHAKNAENEKAYEKKIVYKYVPQAFLKAYVEAWKRYSAGEDNPYYLVIEEINRGNCAQIFGDLFQLLDRNNMGCSSYAISADEDIAQFLRDDVKGFALKKTKDGEGLTQQQRDVIASFKLEKDSGEVEEIGFDILDGSKLLLPPNLRIWATMNTSDQSLFPIDSAFKRRWNWEYMPIEYDPTDKNTGERLAWKLEVRGKMYYWGQFLDYINPRILKLTMSEDKQMGYFFAKPNKRGRDGRLDIISEKVFVNKVLFYLWTDVFKDYDLTEAPFVYEHENSKTRTAYRFTDFFSTKGDDMLARFVEGFKLPVVEEQSEEDQDTDPDETYREDGNNNSRTLDHYTVNGNGNFLMGPAAIQAMNIFIANNPDYSANEIVSEWSSFKWPKVYTTEQYEEKKSKSIDTRIDKRYTPFDLSNGDTIYMSIGFIPETMADFIHILDTKDWGITIRKID